MCERGARKSKAGLCQDYDPGQPYWASDKHVVQSEAHVLDAADTQLEVSNPPATNSALQLNQQSEDGPWASSIPGTFQPGIPCVSEIP